MVSKKFEVKRSTAGKWTSLLKNSGTAIAITSFSCTFSWMRLSLLSETPANSTGVGCISQQLYSVQIIWSILVHSRHGVHETRKEGSSFFSVGPLLVYFAVNFHCRCSCSIWPAWRIPARRYQWTRKYRQTLHHFGFGGTCECTTVIVVKIGFYIF